MAWSNLPTDFADAVYTGLRKYRMIDNQDNTVSFEDQTEYESYENSFYRAEDVNKAFEAINNLMNASQAAVDTSICSGRLSLSSSNPIPSNDIRQANTLYYLPYCGNKIAIYKDGVWKIRIITSISLSLENLNNEMPYDVFISEDENGNLVLSLSAWETEATREEGSIVWLDGVKVSGTDAEKRYIGSIALNADGYGEDSASGRMLWNQYNQEPRPILSKLVTSATHGTAHMGSWAPYYDDEAPMVRLLVPFRESEFNLCGIGLNADISESDRAYGRAAALGILKDPMTLSPYTGNSNCADVFTHTSGNSPLRAEIINTKSEFIGFHKYYLGFWSNYSFYPIGTNISACGEAPGLTGIVRG